MNKTDFPVALNGVELSFRIRKLGVRFPKGVDRLV
jgi:hypothetical protein